MRRFFVTISSGLVLFALIAGVVQAATFTWNPQTVSIDVDQETTLTIGLDTQGAQTTGSDVVLNYDQNVIEITSVMFADPVYPRDYINIDSGAGTITANSTVIDVSNYYDGIWDFIQLTVKGKTAGTSSISFACTTGDTADTNIVERLTAQDVVDCSSLSAATVTVGGGGDGGDGGDNGDGGTTQCLAADINQDGTVNSEDRDMILTEFFSTNPSNPRIDINSDGIVGVIDYSLVSTSYLQSTGACT